MFETVFLGLINFFELDDERGRLVLIPDGRDEPKKRIDPANRIEPHYAAILVRRADVVDDTNWPATGATEYQGQLVSDFRIDKPSTIVISGMESAGAFDDSHFDGRSIKLRDDIFPSIDIDPAQASTIAEIPIRRGILISSRLANTLAAQLFVPDHAGKVMITARPKDGSAEKTLELEDRTVFAIVNMSEDHARFKADGNDSNDPARSHFRLYAQLDSRRRAEELRDPTPAEINGKNAPEIQSRHPFVEYLRTRFRLLVPETQCTVTGCCHPDVCGR